VIPEIDQKALADGVEAGDVLVLDVRESREYRAGHVPGARSLPLSLLPVRLAELPRGRAVYVVCESGGRSAQATSLLRSVGIPAVNVAGGTGAWIAAGRPVEVGA
jgi:rhodanese-related sulfurtransferase